MPAPCRGLALASGQSGDRMNNKRLNDAKLAARQAKKRGAATAGMTRQMKRMLGAASVQLGADRAMALGEQAIQLSQGTFQSWAEHFDRLVSEEITA